VAPAACCILPYASPVRHSRSLSSLPSSLVVGSRARSMRARRGVEPVRPETSRNGSYVCVRGCVRETHAMAFEMFMYRVPRGTYLGVCPLSSSKLPDHLRNLSSTSTSTYPACHLVIPSLLRLHASRSQPLNHIWPLPLADITAGIFFSTTTNLEIKTTPSQYGLRYIRDKTIINRHYLVN
jgi:hypothetical protein